MGARSKAHRCGADDSILALQMLLDNEAGTVTEWSKTGEKTLRNAADIGSWIHSGCETRLQRARFSQRLVPRINISRQNSSKWLDGQPN
jgi:hypothetical protein